MKSHSRLLLVTLAILATTPTFSGCQEARHIVQIEVMSTRDVQSIEVDLISLDTLRPPFTDTSPQNFTPARSAADLRVDPIRVSVELEGPALVMVHIKATSTSGEQLVATRCYGVDGIIEDQVLLDVVGATDLDGDSFVPDPSAVCVEPTPEGGQRACDEFDFVCPPERAADCNDDPAPLALAPELTGADVYPGAPTRCRNGVDEDCDGSDEPCADNDEDGFPGCPPTPTPDCDCDDSEPGISPAAMDICLDGIDQDCDGVDAPCDNDGDGFTADENGLPDCDDNDATVYPGATETPGGECDGKDNNCNDLIDEVDECRPANLDGDPADACPPGTTDTSGCDCNDCDPGIYGGPGSREICQNGFDDDCDGTVDEGCPDPSVDMDGDGQSPPQDCDDTDPYAYTHAPGEPVIDLCGNGVAATCVPGEDRPCSEDADGDGYVEPDQCEGNAAVGPLVPETCNGIDDDCDGVIDEVYDMGMPPTMGCIDGTPVDFFATDFGHCGACRNLCNAETANQCTTGTCDCSTDPGTGECTAGGRPACCMDGCVDLLENVDNCGACGRRCGEGETCVAGVCTCGGTNGPDATMAGSPQACAEPSGLEPPMRRNETQQCCAGSCTDVLSDDANCGLCGRVCGPHSSCGEPVGAAGFCHCDPASGSSRWFDCNGDLSAVGNDGCEIDLENDVNNCNTCGNMCTRPGATAVCNAGSCEIGACLPNFNDCNMADFDGCEADFRSRQHCGGCGSVCGTAETCDSMRCTCGPNSGTPGGGAVCTGATDTCCGSTAGCRNIDDDNAHCGACGVPCGAGEDCNSGRCTCGTDQSSVGGGEICVGGTPHCGPSDCVACLNDGHCTVNPNRQCVTNVCRRCDPADDAGCGGSTPACHSTMFTCVNCEADGDCSGSTSQCVGTTCRACDPADDAGCGGSTPQCNASFVCVQCLNDGHCGGSNQCVSQMCRTCDPADDAGCGGSTPQCDPSTFMCVECLNDGHCGGGQCVSNVCRACDPADDAGCSGSTPVCNSSTFMCVGCEGDGDCGGATPQCVSGTCRACDPMGNQGCGGATPICSPTTFTCICTMDSQCGGATPQCVAGTCRQCDPADDAGCTGGTPECIVGPPPMCVECDDNGDCDDSNPCTMDTCSSNSCSNTVTPGASCMGGSGMCDDAGTCCTGCIDGTGTCVTSPDRFACGAGGGTCVACVDDSNAICDAGTCRCGSSSGDVCTDEMGDNCGGGGNRDCRCGGSGDSHCTSPEVCMSGTCG